MNSNQQTIDQINSIQTRFITQFGKSMLNLRNIVSVLICLEGIIAGIVLSISKVYGLDTDQIMAGLWSGTRTRITQAKERT